VGFAVVLSPHCCSNKERWQMAKNKRRFAKGSECAVVFCKNGDVALEVPNMDGGETVGDHILLATAIAVIVTNKRPNPIVKSAIEAVMNEIKEGYVKGDTIQ
jgi:hypothetical protein